MNAYWAARSPGERRVLATAAFVVAGLLVIALVWMPLEQTRRRLAAELPRLAASVATMEQQAAEVARVRALPAAPASAATPATAVATALGTRLPGAQVAPLDEKRVRITGTDVAYGTLLEAIAAAQSGFGMRVDSARIDALPVVGRVRAELVLARP